ncbi:MAG TPA: radical SAM protein [Gemmatimonadales bacterium]|nr:radical SAM protein [Gemmatimonadales bacterium]
MKLLLVSPTSPLWRTRAPGEYRGPRAFRFSMLSSLYVAAAMPPGVETRVVDEDVEPVDFEAEADLVGVSFMTYNAPRAYEIADEFRRRGKTVIAGGYHPTFLPEEAARHFDAVCVGEAEANVPAMLADLAAGGLRKVYRRESGPLAGLPVPDRSLIRRGAYITPDAVQATRGCPYACTFCSVAAFCHHSFRTRPVEEVADELAGLGRRVLFVDDNIIGDRDYALDLFARIAPLGKQWCSQCSVRIADDPRLLEAAARSGCIALFLGLESLSDGNLGAWRKTTNRAGDYARAVTRLHAAGIGVYAGFVFGMDDDDAATFERTLAFLDTAHVDVLQCTILTPFPGTPLFDDLERQGRIRTRDWELYDFGHVVFEPRRLSPEALLAGASWVESRFYSRRAAWRRIVRAFGYLRPAAVVGALMPLSLGYVARSRAYGVREKARGHERVGSAPLPA